MITITNVTTGCARICDYELTIAGAEPIKIKHDREDGVAVLLMRAASACHDAQLAVYRKKIEGLSQENSELAEGVADLKAACSMV